MNKKKFAEVKSLVDKLDQKKCQAKEVVQDTDQVLNEDVGNEEEPDPSETELLEKMAEKPLDESKPMQVGMFTIKTFNQVIDDGGKNGELTPLYDEFWFESETCCLYGDSNVGKSILAVQIAHSIASKGKKVLYFDFELSEAQISRRYTDKETKERHSFPKNMYHVSLNYMMSTYSAEELPDQIIRQMETLVKKIGASVIIIDNLTWIVYNSRSSKMAGELMKRLSAMKNQYNLSMLILAHTPKRNMSKPITQNDLGGSKMIMNFLDSAFAIGCSAKDPNYRYIKQIKVRYAEMKYGEDNICLCEIQPFRSFLMLQRVGNAIESEHLKKLKDGDKEALIVKIKAMRANGKSIREIAAELGMSPATVNRYSNK